MTAVISMKITLPVPFDRLPPGAASPFRLNANEALFRTGDTSRGCFVLVSGEVKMLRWTGEGNQSVIHIARAGETFAEAALFASHYHCDGVAARASSGVLLRKRDVMRLFREDPAFAEALARRFARDVQSLRRRLELHMIRPATERVMAALEQFRASDGGDLENLPPLKTLAAQIGLSHEALYRAVAALVRDGRLVRQSRGRVSYPP
jgi:CRP-like cAMP-binding protein